VSHTSFPSSSWSPTTASSLGFRLAHDSNVGARKSRSVTHRVAQIFMPWFEAMLLNWSGALGHSVSSACDGDAWLGKRGWLGPNCRISVGWCRGDSALSKPTSDVAGTTRRPKEASHGMDSEGGRPTPMSRQLSWFLGASGSWRTA